MTLSTTPVSVPKTMTTTQRNALPPGLPTGTQIFNSTTIKYEYTVDGGSNWLQLATGVGASGLNANYLVDPNIIYDGVNPVQISTSFSPTSAYNAPGAGVATPANTLWGFQFTPGVSGFVTSLQYPDAYLPSGSRLVQIYNNVVGTKTLLLSANVSKTDLLVGAFRTNRNVQPLYLTGGQTYWCTVVVPTTDNHNVVPVSSIPPITILGSYFTSPTTTPGVPTNLFAAGSSPPTAGFEFIQSSMISHTRLYSNNIDALNSKFSINHGSIIFTEAASSNESFPSIVAGLITDAGGGIPAGELVTVSTLQDCACRMVSAGDLVRTIILGTAANSTGAAGQIQYIHGLRIIPCIANANISRGENVMRSNLASGRVMGAGAGGNGTFGISLQNVASGQTFLAALLNSMT